MGGPTRLDVTTPAQPPAFDIVTPAPPPADEAILERDGLAGIAFGIPMPEAISRLEDILGPPDEVGPLACVGDFARWGDLRIQTDPWEDEADIFGGYWLQPSGPSAQVWSTPEGIRVGSTVAQVRSLAGLEFRTGYDIGLADHWSVQNDPDDGGAGGYGGAISADSEQIVVSTISAGRQLIPALSVC